ncbi:hypothetical protein DSM106972_077510 [Dulcicalothrix desertica PCC 7102]|uniref:Uncharacterized protein n=1 Tax=Dulcicalothrix desertica PCC 7102 TaxID=232991 RepID=A0A433UZM7_9CYAN|nr:hypothetical protein [Dulcicalothrix desertica]RUS99309.1 hypothetical protein DSM106972_077510 [Dulcicalothrix desertica PCC 7102]
MNFAVKHDCKVIVFEYLTSLRPIKGKYSKRSNQKRMYWLKSKIYLYTSHIARTKHNLLSARVNPKNTSKYSAIDNSELLRTNDHEFAEYLATNPSAWDTFKNTQGYHPGLWAISRNGYMIHSGLNACRNIGMKFYKRYTEKLKFVRV